MMKLVYSRTTLESKRVFSMLADMAVVYQELEKYGLAFLEICPRSWLVLNDGELRLSMFHGLVHPYASLGKNEYVNENLPPPEYVKHHQVHPKSNVYALGYLMYLLTGLKFAFQFYEPSGMRKAVMNFYKVLPQSKMRRNYPEDVTSIIEAMVHKNPEGRPSWGRPE